MTTLPQSIEAEVNILGALLMTDGKALDEAPLLLSDHFFTRSHRIIFDAILSMSQNGKPVDAVSVTMELKSGGRLEEVGGVSYLSQISGAVATAAHILFYQDVLIEKWKARQLIEIASHIPESLESGEVQEVIAETERKIFYLNQTGQADENQLEVGIKEVLESITRRDNPEVPVGINSGVLPWQENFGGILPGRFYVIGGLPGSGKSALVEQMTLHCLLHQKRVLFLSKEMRRDRILERMVSKHAGVNYSKFIRNGSLLEERNRMRRAATQIKETDLYLLNPVQMDGFQLRSIVRRETRRKPIDLIVVDYIQKLNLPKAMDRLEGTAENSIQLSETVIETNIPIIALVQFSKSYKGEGRPSARDIKETSQIEQDADCILLLWKDKEDRWFTFDKNRDGPEHDEKVFWNGELMTFSALAHQ